MNHGDLNELLRRRDDLMSTCPEFRDLKIQIFVTDEEIRELGRIVLETTDEETAVFSTT